MSDAAPLSAVARITNKRGLHARASAKLAEAASRFKAHITVSKDGQTVEGRSVMNLMMLAANLGTEVEISAEGEDAQEALTAILALIAANFGEE
jgi:phosphocarrier protein